jgi:hypothetical protein
MTWTYSQSSGEISLDNTFVGRGYSGTHEGRNNPEMESVEDVGPIPAGFYSIGEAYDDIGALGPCVMALDPADGTETFGRTAFRIHGDNVQHDASHGCIIMPPAVRHEIASSTDRALLVVS